MAAITELGYARFGVADLDAWRTFAGTILGLEVCEGDAPDSLYLRADYWHHRIALQRDASDDVLGVGLRVAGAEEFAELRAQLEAAGVKLEVGSREGAAQRHVLEFMELADPAGNPLEIFHGPRVDAHRPFHPGRGMHGRFLTGDGGLGHMILRHAGLDETYRFYRGLGMRGGIEYKLRQPDGNEAEILFLHCNSRDHTVAFGPPSSKRINHLMLEVDNLDDVYLTYERVQASDYPVTISPGKHANDHMFSFYCATPSGWMVEVGCGGRPATHQSEYYTRDAYGHEFSPRG